jgi:cbb3-type cytochrome oxidase subunit 1
MSRITVWFVRSSLVYFGIGVLLGISMAVYPAGIEDLRFAHIHLNLLGWVSMMIFGVSYHVFPRFSGNPLWSERLARWHFITANIGLIGMVVFYPFRSSLNSLFIAFASIEAVSVFMFLLNMFKTIKAES